MEDKVKVIKDFIIDSVSNKESAKKLLYTLSDEVPDEEYTISSDKFHNTYMNNIFKSCIIQSDDCAVNHVFAIDYEYIYIFTELIGKHKLSSVTKFTLDRMISIIEGGNNE